MRTMRLIRLSFFISLFLISNHIATAQQQGPNNSLPGTDIQWIQKILNNWDSACRLELNIRVDALPWIIFYDSVAAWHLNPDIKKLPAYTKTNQRFLFKGKYYPLVKISHSMNLWVPDRNPIPIGSLPTTTIPYGNNQKTFFIAPLPSLFKVLAPPDQLVYLKYLFLGMNMHELTHTLQLPFVLPKVLQTERSYKLPESIDDNIVESTFKNNEGYLKLFFAEKTHLWNALFTENADSSITHIEEAFRIADQRIKEFLSGDSTGYSKMEDIFIALEGSAMWAQYRMMLRNIPPGMNRKEILGWLLQRTGSWSQEEGLVLFLLIDKLKPNWKHQFFGKELPSAFQYLRDIITNKKRK